MFLCDSYNRVTNKTTGKKMGMPILYYKADTAKIRVSLMAIRRLGLWKPIAVTVYIYIIMMTISSLLILDTLDSDTYVHTMASGWHNL